MHRPTFGAAHVVHKVVERFSRVVEGFNAKKKSEGVCSPVIVSTFIVS